ncbi:EF hand domain-containing protein [Toxoplasma gondii]|uniref:EF hand domain-containing protein n=1 Tax=Toxoplasma gondii TaxID=5811 RepID=A0A7J6K9X2_TOXGO|nr:EF hand domain-containing protein [Toxoplasma gondii]
MAVAFEVDICAAREVEKCRKELAMRQDFSLAQLWKLFDPNSRGFATNFELRRTLASLGIPLSIRVVNLFLRRYGSAATGASKRITYAGMCDAVMPQDAHASHQLRNRVAKSGSSAFSRVTLFHLLELLKMLMQAEVLAESIRHVFASSTMFAPLRKLDPDNHGVICSKALTDYLKSMGVFATQNEISNLLARIVVRPTR